MIKPSDIQLSNKSVTEGDRTESKERSKELVADAFASLLNEAGNVNQLGPVPIQQVVQSEGGIRLSFAHSESASQVGGAGSDGPRRGVPMNRPENANQPGSRNSHLREQTFKGRNMEGKLEQPDQFEASQKGKKKAAKTVPGSRVVTGDLSESKDVKKTDLDSAHKLPRGMNLNMRGTDLRADGTPILRDADGQAKTAGASNPDNSIKSHIEASGAEAIEQATRAVSKKAPAEKSAPAEYSERVKEMKEEAPARQAESVKDKMGEELSPVKTAKPKGGQKAETAGEQAKGESPKGEKAGGPAETDSKTPLFDTAAKNTAEIKLPKGASAAPSAVATKGGNPVATKGKGGSQAVPTVGVNLKQVASAITAGKSAAAASRMANLLGARIDYIINHARPEVRIAVTPRSIGDLRFRLMGNGDKTDIFIYADKETAGRIMEHAAPQILHHFSKNGVQVGQFEIEYGQSDGQYTATDSGHSSEQASEDGSFQNHGQDNPGDQASPRTARSTHDGDIDVVA